MSLAIGHHETTSLAVGRRDIRPSVDASSRLQSLDEKRNYISHPTLAVSRPTLR